MVHRVYSYLHTQINPGRALPIKYGAGDQIRFWRMQDKYLLYFTMVLDPQLLIQK